MGTANRHQIHDTHAAPAAGISDRPKPLRLGEGTELTGRTRGFGSSPAVAPERTETGAPSSVEPYRADGGLLHRAMRAAGVSMEQLARVVGRDKSVPGQWCTSRSMPLEHMSAIAAKLPRLGEAIAEEIHALASAPAVDELLGALDVQVEAGELAAVARLAHAGCPEARRRLPKEAADVVYSARRMRGRR